jgi:hypothetical protein
VNNSTNPLNLDDGLLWNSASPPANGCSRSTEPDLPSEDQAATTVQRVYRGHRARRQFADDTLMPIWYASFCLSVCVRVDVCVVVGVQM